MRNSRHSDREKARQVLLACQWKEDEIQWVLGPTPEGDSNSLPLLHLKQDRIMAIRALHGKGWGAHEIALAIPISEAEIARIIKDKMEGKSPFKA